MIEDTALIRINEAEKALIEARDLTTILEIRDRAKAFAAYATAKKAGNAANMAKEVQIRAERKAGAFLADMEKATGTRGQLAGRDSSGPSMMEGPESNTPTLAELGIGYTQSHRWQAIAGLADDKFEQYIADTIAADKELTSAAVYRLALKGETKTPPMPTGKYRVVYADPPWKYGNVMPDYFIEQAHHYRLMDICEIYALPIAGIVEDDAVLFLWATSPILEEVFAIIRAWGFTYKASFVWDKVKHNMGHYNSVRHEFLLICTRGSCQPDVQKLFDSVITYERGERHSEKPAIFREMIDTLYPNGKRIELFAREKVGEWDVWGAEIP